MKKKIPVAILGACGALGQQYVARLVDHPWFEIGCLIGSDKTTGLNYSEAVGDRWHLDTPISDVVSKISLLTSDKIEEIERRCAFVFSALPTDQALATENRFAHAGLPVISSAQAHRALSDVPLIIPELNASHLEVIGAQQKNRGWEKGFIVTKPNCAVQSYLIALAPLHHAFGVKKVVVTTLQALSGAGLLGLGKHRLENNIVPYIANEEEKGEIEPLKILGTVKKGRIVPMDGIRISTHCNRVPVIDGHLACVSVAFEKKPNLRQMLHCMTKFSPLALPSSPKNLIIYQKEPNRPQPLLDRDAGKGMALTVGRVRPCPVLDVRFVALSHNTVRGGAGGGILTAELLIEKGYIRHG